MAYKGMLKINNIWVPTPTTFDFSTEDLEDEAFRTADGLMHRQRVGKKIKLTCVWQVIPESNEYYSLVSLLDGLPEFFPVQFPHPNGNNNYVITAYRGNPLSTSMRSYYDNGKKKISYWKNLKVNFIER